MLDVLMIGLALLGFVVCALFVRACERMHQGKDA
jgi:hypothetical protein